jgi:hypothetical protein
MIQDAQVNAMDDCVGPPSPVFRRPQSVLTSGCTFQQCAAVRQARQLELSSPGNQVSLQMLWRDVRERTPLIHRSRTGRDSKLQLAGLVPDLDRFHVRTGGELAIPYGTRAGSVDPCALGVG